MSRTTSNVDCPFAAIRDSFSIYLRCLPYIEAATATRKKTYLPCRLLNLTNWLYLCKPMLNFSFQFASILMQLKQFPSIFHKHFYELRKIALPPRLAIQQFIPLITDGQHPEPVRSTGHAGHGWTIS